METPTPDPLFGITLHERYILGKRVRSGASGTTHAAHDLGTERTVTVTVMHPWMVGDHGAVHAFLGRAQELGSAFQPGLAGVLGQGRDGDHVYAVTEYLPGKTLAEVLADGEQELRYSPYMALSVVAAVLTSLNAAHNAGIVHGDLDVGKVVMDGDGEVRVTGFPLLFDAEEDAGPETRTDVRAAGVLLYTLLTGAAAGPDAHPLRPSSSVPGLPPELDMLVANATDPNPRYRPRDAGQYLTLVEQVLRSLPGIPSEPGDEDTRPIPVITDLLADEDRDADRGGPVPLWRRTPVLVTAGVLVLLLFAVGWALAPEGRTVLPDVLGTSPDTAEARLVALDLDLDVRFDQTYSDTADPGSIAESTPVPGTELERGADVLLSVSVGSRTAEVPDVVGGTEHDARTELREAGFTDVEIVQEHSAEATPGTVISTDPEAGTQGDREEAVTLHVSEGVIVPTLIGMTGEEAGTALAGLGLATEVVEAHHDTVPVGEVSGQTPEPGTILPEEGAVTLTVSLGPEPEEEEESPESSPAEDDGEDDGDREEDSHGDSGNGADGESCGDVEKWDSGTTYDTGDRVRYRGRVYESNWWIQGIPPSTSEEWGAWEDQGPC